MAEGVTFGMMLLSRKSVRNALRADEAETYSRSTQWDNRKPGHHAHLPGIKFIPIYLALFFDLSGYVYWCTAMG